MSRLAAVLVAAWLCAFSQSLLAADAKDNKDSAIPKVAKLVHLATGKVLGVENDAEDPESHLMLMKDREPKADSAAKDDSSKTDAKADAKKPSAAMLKAQQWKLEKDGDEYKILNRKSDMALDVPAYSTDEDTQIITYGEKPGPDDIDNQRWLISSATLPKSDAKADAAATDAKPADKAEPAPKLFRIRSKSSGMVLDVDGDGFIVQKHAVGGAKSQLWILVEVKE